MVHDQDSSTTFYEDRKRSAQTSADEGQSRKRRSRWASATEKAPPVIPATLQAGNLTKEQLDLYVIHLRVEEIGRKLKTGDYIPPEKDRSPSPEPIYGAEGKRINTREFRYRKKLEDERHKLVSAATKIDSSYRPPADYKRPSKLVEKIYIPVREFPEINFIGLLLGPRGSTLKDMEMKSRAKIAIRGKGSVKEGKGAPSSYQNQEEDLHCLITADSEDKVIAAVKLVNNVIETASTVPEGQNELKRKQLRDLAALNGTLRDDENQVCNNCGALGHKKWNCPEKQNFTNNITCRICGGVGHMARDCRERNNPEALEKAKVREKELDSEYQSFMQELGGGPNRGQGGGDRGSRPWQSGGSGGGSGSSAPWARSSESSSAAPWQQSGQQGSSQNPNQIPIPAGSGPAINPPTAGAGASSANPMAAYAAAYSQYYGAQNPWAQYMAAMAQQGTTASSTATQTQWASYMASMAQQGGATGTAAQNPYGMYNPYGANTSQAGAASNTNSPPNSESTQ